MIDGVRVRKLDVVSDERGRLMEILRFSWTDTMPKQVYMTTAYEGVTKDREKFHMHKFQTDFFCCVKGRIMLVLVDTRKGSGTEGEIDEFRMGEDNFSLVTIPKRVLHAFKSLKGEAFIINCIDSEYNREDPDEFRIENGYYDWGALRPLEQKR